MLEVPFLQPILNLDKPTNFWVIRNQNKEIFIEEKYIGIFDLINNHSEIKKINYPEKRQSRDLDYHLSMYLSPFLKMSKDDVIVVISRENMCKIGVITDSGYGKRLLSDTEISLDKTTEPSFEKIVLYKNVIWLNSSRLEDINPLICFYGRRMSEHISKLDYRFEYLVKSTIYDIFTNDSFVYLNLEVCKKDGILLGELEDIVVGVNSTVNKSLDLIKKVYPYLSIENLSVKINIQSPGKILLYLRDTAQNRTLLFTIGLLLTPVIFSEPNNYIDYGVVGVDQLQLEHIRAELETIEVAIRKGIEKMN